jgi:hypothetical protein
VVEKQEPAVSERAQDDEGPRVAKLLKYLVPPRPRTKKDKQTYLVTSPHPIIDGIYTGQRGDNRPPGLIGQIGFNFKPAGKGTLKQYGGVRGFMKKFAYTSECVKWGGFVHYITNQKLGERPVISTSVGPLKKNQGFTSNYHYKIVIPDMKEIELTEQHLQFTPEVPFELPLKAYIKKVCTLWNSPVLGINLNVATNEVAFVTKIEKQYVVQYIDDATGKWVDMPKDLKKALKEYNTNPKGKKYAVTREDLLDWDDKTWVKKKESRWL